MIRLSRGEKAGLEIGLPGRACTTNGPQPIWVFCHSSPPVLAQPIQRSEIRAEVHVLRQDPHVVGVLSANSASVPRQGSP